MTGTFEELAAAAAGGEVDAADALVRGLHSRIVSHCQVRGIASGDLDDVAQRVTIQTLKSLDRYSPDRPFLPWFHAVARNVTSAYWRSQKREGLRMGALREGLMPSIEAAEADDE